MSMTMLLYSVIQLLLIKILLTKIFDVIKKTMIVDFSSFKAI